MKGGGGSDYVKPMEIILKNARRIFLTLAWKIEEVATLQYVFFPFLKVVQ